MSISNLELTVLTQPPPDGICLSLYAPTHRAGRAKAQDPIRLRNMIRDAERRLQEKGLRPPAVEELTAPARAALQTPGFWRRQDLGLAVFSSADVHLHYPLPIRPPRTLVVSSRFHLKPLMPLLYNDGLFFILALSQNVVRAFWGTRDHIVSADMESIPKSLADTFKPLPPEEHLQWHTRTGDISVRGRRAAVFHGQGGRTDGKKDDLLRYCQRIDRGVRRSLRGRRIPLIIAGVDYLLPIYRKANTYPNLSAELTIGNPDRLHAAELHKLAWKAMKPIVAKRREDAFRSYQQLAGEGDNRACSDLQAILAAAFQGRVAALFVDTQCEEWGSYDAENGRMVLTPTQQDNSEDLLNLAAVQTYLHDGSVFAVDRKHIPSDSPIAAQLRY
jgi:hypothetical protein